MPLALMSTPDKDILVAAQQERDQAARILKAVPDLAADRFHMRVDAGPEEQIPPELAALLSQVMRVLARGGTLTIGSLPDELTTTVAAGQLGISRKTLMKHIRDGQIPSHKVGTHTRVKTADILDFKRERLRKQRVAFDELRALEDSLEEQEMRRQ